MLKRILVFGTIAVSLVLLQTSLAQEPASETIKTRLNKQETIDQMLKIGRMSAQQQNSRIDSLWQNLSASKTPRSDFLFCMGLAYLGNYKAQRCVGSAYEKGIGIVEDQSEAYTWYAVALQNKISDKGNEEKIDADKERVQNRLLAAYPHPTEDDLDDMVSAQQTRMTQYQDDTKKAKR
jgi:TPR repeat protein